MKTVIYNFEDLTPADIKNLEISDAVLNMDIDADKGIITITYR